jgi:hypothetical protein
VASSVINISRRPEERLSLAESMEVLEAHTRVPVGFVYQVAE